MTEPLIYLDHHAATPVDPRVREVMRRAEAEAWANPSSAHQAGRAARRALEQARAQVAAAIGARPADVVLTAGGTEACNLGALGVVPDAARVTLSAIEHPAVEAALEGRPTRRLPVLAGRPPDADALPLEGAQLACLQLVNHETGTVLPVARYAARCREAGVRLFVDATAAFGKVELDVEALGADAVAIASSKIGGPPGAGALWIARDAAVDPRQRGGAQERGRRAGSPDVVALAGFGAAAALAAERRAAMAEVGRLRDRLEAAAVSLGAVVNGDPAHRVATVTNLSAPGWRGARLVAALDLEGLCASAGAACSSGVDGPSRVIAAMYPDEPWRAEAALRLSLGPGTTPIEIERAIAILRRVLPRRGPRETSSGF